MTTETILTDKEISKTLVDAGILLVPQEITGYDIVIARAIEQAVLQSEQVQAWKRDAARYRWLRETPDAEVRIFIDQPYGGREMSDHFLDDAIDAAMEQQTCEKISQGAYS